MIRSHFFLLCLVLLSCYSNFNLAKIIDECLNQWCQFDNAETTEIELPFQILDGDYFELKTAQEFFYNVRVSFYSTEKTKWYISDYFLNGEKFSFYLPSEYYGGNQSDVDDSCGPILGKQKYFCEKNNECKVMFAMDEKRKISFPSLSVDRMELWKNFDKIVLGGGSEVDIIQFKYVASSDTSSREKPLPFNDELDKHVNEEKEQCHIFQKYPFSAPPSTTTASISTTTTPTGTISTSTPTMSSSSSTTASTTYIPTTNTRPSDGNTLSTTPTNPSSTSLGQNSYGPSMPTSNVTPTTSISSSTTAFNIPPVIPGSSTPSNRNTISTTAANNPSTISPGQNPSDRTTTTPLNTNQNNGSSRSSAQPPINGNNSSKPICIDPNNCPNPTPGTPKKNGEKTTTAKIATAGSSGGLTDKSTWIADENGWVGEYANRNRALIFVFGNCVIFAAFFITIFAMTCGGCLFNDTS